MVDHGDFAQNLKQQADIVRIIGDYVRLRKAGAQNFTGLCPFHHEKTPSFSVHATRQFFHCFGCGESGDVYKFLQKIENVTFPEAVRLLAQKLGVPLPKVTYNSEAEAREARVRMALLDLHEQACNWFQEQLRRPEGAQARQYLAGRGLNAETITRFRIGYAPDSGFLLRDALRGEGKEELLKESGLFSWKESAPESAAADTPGGKAATALYSKFRNRVQFPITNESGRVIAFTGRTLAADEKSGPKYLNSPETAIYSKSLVLFNLDKAKEFIRKVGYAILVEGQMDCISLFAAGAQNVIASSGTAFTEAQARLLGRFSKKIVVNFDPDAAGAAAAERSLATLVEREFDIKVLTLEEGYDPDLFIRRKGYPEYVKALHAAPKYFDYLIDRARQRFPQSGDGKVKALNFLLPHIQRVPSRIVRDELANEIAQKLGINSDVLRQELRHAAGARGAVQVKVEAQTLITPAERVLLRVLMEAEAEMAEPVRQTLAVERLHEGLSSQELFEALLQAGAGADPMALPISPADQTLLAEALLRSDAEELTPELVEGALEALRLKRLRVREREIRADVAKPETGQDSAQVLREKLELARKLARGRTTEAT
jgi:DNA primase